MSSKYGSKTQPIVYRNYKEPLTRIDKGFGYYGVIAESENQEYLQCHECGEFVKSLSHHASKHKMTATEYKDKYKIGRTISLLSTKTRGLRQEIFRDNADKILPKAIEGMEKYRDDVEKGKRPYVMGRKGLPLEKRNRMGTCPDQLLDRLAKLAVVRGEHPSYRYMAKNHGGLLRSILTTFGSYRKAVVMAGVQENLDYDTRTYTKEQLLDFLRNFYKRHGRTVMVSDFRTGELPSYNRYLKVFGGISQARAAAGIPNYVIRSNNTFVEA